MLYYAGSVTVNEDIGSAQYGQAYDTMSSFSSWGVPGSLELKPEITAPGGSIYCVYGKTRGGAGFVGGEDQYEVMSGHLYGCPPGSAAWRRWCPSTSKTRGWRRRPASASEA